MMFSLLVVLASTPTVVLEAHDIQAGNPHSHEWSPDVFLIRPDWTATRIDWRVRLDERNCTVVIDVTVRSDVYLDGAWLWPAAGHHYGMVELVQSAPQCGFNGMLYCDLKTESLNEDITAETIRVPYHEVTMSWRVRTTRL